MFGLGLEPTGSKDPFALRRAANGIVKILAETELPLTLQRISGLAAKDEAIAKKMTAFFRERLDFYLREVRGQAYDVVAAVLAAGANDVRDVIARAEAVTAVRGGDDFAAVSAAFKRMKNILAQVEASGDLSKPVVVVVQAQQEPAQAALANAASQIRELVADYSSKRVYVPALEAIATLRPHVDTFFEQLMVLDPNISIRASRVQLLRGILQDFSGIADFSLIVTAS
jgi:glycyl-tRNA synthetase beta chain